MAGVVIVALPSEDEKVQRLSSEKVPHLTLVYLGEDVPGDQLVEIVEFVEHAASQLSPFGLSVDRRGTLGADEADVVFFEKTSWEFPRISAFRAHLLQNDAIQRAYNSAEQFPEWTPHLTLGYPETPAKPDDSDYPGLHHVNFDRISVWVGDFEGPTFRLKYETYAQEVSMSDMTAAQRGESAVKDLFHYGVKGMKWGVTSVDKAARPTLTREQKSIRNSKDVTVTQRKAGTYAKAKGGQRQKATDDAVKAVAARQKAKKSTTDSLTNDELKAAVDRMQLEQQYAKLSSKTKRRGQSFVARFLTTPEGRKVSADLANRVATKLAAG